MFYPILFKDNTLYSITQNEYECLYDSINKNFNDENLLSIINEYEKKGFDVILPKIDEAEYGRWRWGFNKENIERLSYDVIVTKTNKGYTLYKKQRPELGELPQKNQSLFFINPNTVVEMVLVKLKNYLLQKFLVILNLQNYFMIFLL